MKRRQEITVVKKDIAKLFVLSAEKSFREPTLANRYVFLARKMALKYRISLREYNRTFCRKCNTYFTSKTVRVRTRSGTIVYSCLSCGNVKRIRKG